MAKKSKTPKTIDWDNLPDYIFSGSRRIGVSERLKDYIMNLKDKGMSMCQAAAHAGCDYGTIITQRGRHAEFEKYELAAQKYARGSVANTLFENATDKDSKLQVSASSLWLKFIHAWVEPRQEIKLTEGEIGYDFSRWSKADMKVAEKFLSLVEKYENDYE